MEDISVFMEKAIEPTEEALEKALGESFSLWQDLKDHVMQVYPAGKQEWNFPGKKYGWSFRIKDKRRAILYFLPREGYFKAAFVFGEKAMKAVLESTIDEKIKTDLKNARKYAEGRGVSIEIFKKQDLGDIRTLVDIKMAH